MDVHYFWDLAVATWQILYWDGVTASFMLISTYYFVKVVSFWRKKIGGEFET